MNKRFKIILFTLIGVVVVIGLAVGGFFLLRASSSADVYNLQIVNAEGNPVNDVSRYLLTNATNSFEVNVNMETSSGHNSFYFTSSDSSVAKVVSKDQKFFVEYYKAGKTTITAHTNYSSAVYDSFVLNVYNNFVADITISNAQDNTLHIFADNTEYSYDYIATGVLENIDCNNMQIRVIDNYDKNVFSKISIDPVSKKIKIKTNQVTTDSLQVFYLQTYYVNNAGEECIVKNYAYYVDVVGYRIVDVQLLVSATEKFAGNSKVLLNTNWLWESNDKKWVNNGSVNGNPYLGYNENIIDNLVLSDSVKDLYFKVRIIYSNSSVEDVSKNINYIIAQKDDPNEGLDISGSASTKMDCLRLQFKATPPESGIETKSDEEEYFTVKYERKDIQSSIEKQFKITYKYEGSESFEVFKNKDLYAKVVRNVNGEDTEFVRYEYIYWDVRYRRKDAITDINGYIVGFHTDAPTCDEEKTIVIG